MRVDPNAKNNSTQAAGTQAETPNMAELTGAAGGDGAAVGGIGDSNGDGQPDFSLDSILGDESLGEELADEVEVDSAGEVVSETAGEVMEDVILADYSVEVATTEAAAESPATTPAETQTQPQATTAATTQATPARVSVPLPMPTHDPLADINEEIEAVSERIVSHSVEISKLEQQLKDQKSLWKSASKEQVGLFLRRAEIIAEANERANERAAAESAAAVGVVEVADSPAVEVAGAAEVTPVTPAAVVEDSTTTTTTTTTTTPPTIDGHTASVQGMADYRAAVFAPTGDGDGSGSGGTGNSGANANWWRKKKISDLAGITPKIVDILSANKIETLGDWADWPAKHPGLEYTQISGDGAKITEARYERIADAMEAFLKSGGPAAGVVASVTTTTQAVATTQAAEEVEDI